MKAISAFGTITNMARVGMGQRPCPYCSREHDIVCPRVKSITWADDGNGALVVAVELHNPMDMPVHLLTGARRAG